MIFGIIYVISATISGLACSTADVGIATWQYWVITGCVTGAFLCGRFMSGR